MAAAAAVTSDALVVIHLFSFFSSSMTRFSSICLALYFLLSFFMTGYLPSSLYPVCVERAGDDAVSACTYAYPLFLLLYISGGGGGGRTRRHGLLLEGKKRNLASRET